METIRKSRFLQKNKKNIINLSFAELAQREVKVNLIFPVHTCISIQQQTRQSDQWITYTLPSHPTPTPLWHHHKQYVFPQWPWPSILGNTYKSIPL